MVPEYATPHKPVISSGTPSDQSVNPQKPSVKLLYVETIAKEKNYFFKPLM